MEAIGYIDPTLTILDAERLYNKQNDIAKDAVKIKDLTMRSLCDAIKNYRTNYDYSINIIKEAIKELCITDNRKKKDNLKYLERSISKDFFDNNVSIKIKEIRWYGLNDQAINIYFECPKGTTYYIQIPLKENLDYNYNTFDYGKFSIVKEDGPYSWEVLSSSYDIETVKKYILNNINFK